MDHLIVRAGRRRVLVADVTSSADGHGIGYGILLKRIDKVLWFAQVTQSAVFYIREAKSINTAVFRLGGENVEIVPRFGWQAIWLRCAWFVTAPFRLGSPSLWIRRLLARALLGSVYETLQRSSYVPRTIRRSIVNPWARKLRDSNAKYARLSASAWNQAYSPVHEILRAAEREGRVIPRRLSLPPEREREALAQAAALGIKPTDRLVTVHVREPGYRSAAGLPQRPWDALRNARVETYFKALNALVGRGYIVVRLGDPTMTPIDRPGVVDLATSPHKTEWVEVWCVLHSDFLIGCDSGPSWLAFLVGVPILTVNAIHFRDIARSADRLICKLVRERATGRMLAIADMLTEGYLRSGLDTDKYEHIDNTASDLKNAALDMIDVVGGDEQLSSRQRKFNKWLVALGRTSGHDWSGLEGVACIRRPRGALSRRFADKYLKV